MNINQVPPYNKHIFQMKLERGEFKGNSVQEVSHLFLKKGSQGSYRISQDVTLTPLDEYIAKNLGQWLALHPFCLGCVVSGSADSTVELQLHPIAQIHELEKMEFAVDEGVLDKAKKLNGSLRDIDALIGWLSDQCILDAAPPFPESKRLLVSTGKELDPDLPSSYTLHGRSIRVSVMPHTLPDGERIMKVERIMRTRNKFDPDLPIRLLRGEFAFKDDSRVARLRQEADRVLSAFFSDQDMRSYLSSWEQYGQSQTTLSFEQVLEIGALEYDSYRPLEGRQVSFLLSAQPGRRARSNSLSASKSDVSISSESPSWTSLGSLDLEEIEQNPSLYREDAATSGRFIGMTEQEIILEVKEPEALPKTGCLFVSLTGDLTVTLRRYRAQRAIQQQQTPIPYLHVLLEGVDFPVTGLSVRHPALSARVKEKVFNRNPPTDSQRRAIECALNTPDIAIIQGPPGTGKTTVIQAIVERLNELYRPEETRAGQIIIASYQHDAVENALERITVNGLPSPKIGQKNSDGKRVDDTENSHVERKRFSEEITKMLREQSGRDESSRDNERLIHQDRERLQLIITDFHSGLSTLDSALSSIKEVRSLLSRHSAGDTSLHATFRDLSQRISQRRVQQSDRLHLQRKVWALRSCETSFADDGPQRASELLDALEAHEEDLSDAEFELLEQAVTHRDLTSGQLHELVALRRRLMISLQEERSQSTLLPGELNTCLAAVLARALEALQEQLRLTVRPERRLQLDFLKAIDSERTRFLETLRHYTTVHGTTCQQIAGKYFHDIHQGDMVHDAVLIDEAARANPLDLFIPMARGKKIILVGDHRQLPHIVEENIIEKMLESDKDAPDQDKKTVQDVTREHLQTSLFYKLFASLKAQEQSDGITRTITLNDQFRMHPTLGRFVGDHFYTPHGEPYASPLPESLFAHGLTRYPDQCTAWIDVPHTRGVEVSGQSKTRPVEARQVAEELAQLLQDDPEKKLSFGVITFYKNQVYEINAACRVLGIHDDLISRAVLIGTVDAFQGKEFDVVLLSMVRSRKLFATQLLNEKDLRRTFGHLMNSNRMCVAFSRQKKLLIVVGDSHMLAHPAAQQVIAPLVAFHRLATGGETHD